MWVRSLGWEDPLEKGMATHSSISAWRIPWTEDPGRLAIHGVAKSQTRLKQLSILLDQLCICQKGSFNPVLLSESGTDLVGVLFCKKLDRAPLLPIPRK